LSAVKKKQKLRGGKKASIKGISPFQGEGQREKGLVLRKWFGGKKKGHEPEVVGGTAAGRTTIVGPFKTRKAPLSEGGKKNGSLCEEGSERAPTGLKKERAVWKKGPWRLSTWDWTGSPTEDENRIPYGQRRGKKLLHIGWSRGSPNTESLCIKKERGENCQTALKRRAPSTLDRKKRKNTSPGWGGKLIPCATLK